jgi:hypothetical protein
LAFLGKDYIAVSGPEKIKHMDWNIEIIMEGHNQIRIIENAEQNRKSGLNKQLSMPELK